MNYTDEQLKQALAKMPGAVARKTWHHSSIYINARPDHVGMSGVSVACLASRTPWVDQGYTGMLGVDFGDSVS